MISSHLVPTRSLLKSCNVPPRPRGELYGLYIPEEKCLGHQRQNSSKWRKSSLQIILVTGKLLLQDQDLDLCLPSLYSLPSLCLRLAAHTLVVSKHKTPFPRDTFPHFQCLLNVHIVLYHYFNFSRCQTVLFIFPSKLTPLQSPLHFF